MDRTLIDTAHVMSRRGTCSRRQVGVVIALDDRICSTGFNGAPRGMAHCVHPPDERSSELEPTAPTCQWAVHAEANAVAFAARSGIALDGATLYTTLSPCVVCAQLVINAGITRVVCAVRYRDATGINLLDEAGVAVEILDS
jgi:dCMP deaminase